MKKKTFISFLALLCLFGSELYGQVASPPTAGGSPEGAPAVIYGEINSFHDYDSLTVQIYEQYIWDNMALFRPITLKVPVEEGTFITGTSHRQVFSIATPPISRPSHISIQSENGYLLKDNLVFPGDSVRALWDDKKRQVIFNGPSEQLFTAQYRLSLIDNAERFGKSRSINTADPEELLARDNNRMLLKAHSDRYGIPVHIGPFDFKGHLKELEEGFRSLSKLPGLKYLDTLSNISQAGREILTADYIYRKSAHVFNRFFLLYSYAGDPSRTSMVNDLKDVVLGDIKDLRLPDISKVTQLYSAHFASHEFNRLKSIELLEGTSAHQTIMDDYSGELRERLLTYYLFRESKKMDNGLERTLASLETIRGGWYRERLLELVSGLQTGTELPSFTLMDTSGREFNLDSLKGKTLLLDFWYTGCKACISYHRNTLSKLEEHFGGNPDVVLVSISTDPGKQRWDKSRSQGKYTSDKLLNLCTLGTDHPLVKHFNVFSYPHQVLVGKDHRVYRTGGIPKDPDALITIIERIANGSQKDTLTTIER
ncbi:TlpA family protein disulfide reductase [Echinicola soli]|uniref:TlpA family protein disulfide reductase n=1 Tax=Echinicola soli TaxID=2591634 RepID=A0A514CFY5_9BACT|nr:TlpA disulfide reductase family protein [Echinicola soli]QDH78722.1 TlpA family protein disulfide reductase [Echinicola soli]